MHEQKSPGRRLAMLHRLTMAYMSGPVSAIGLSRGKLGFLMSVLKNEGVNQEELTNNLCIDRAATARALLDMEKSGLIRREEDPDDRRKKLVYPTEKAKALQSRLLDILASHNSALFAGFSENDKDNFLDMLDRMVDNLRNSLEELG